MMTKVNQLVIVACLFSQFLVKVVTGVNYNPDSQLELQWLNATDAGRDNTTSAICADGSPAAYYYDEAEELPVEAPFIIWVGDSPLCTGEECDELCEGADKEDEDSGICEVLGDDYVALDGEDEDEARARCFYARATCTSSWYDEYSSITPLTVLRESYEVFRDYRRVFIPSCSLDWFLGNGDVNDPTSPRFRGFHILEELFQDLIEKRNLHLASSVVVGGTRGGGVAVLNYIRQFQEWLLPSQKLLAIVDSAWYPFFEEFQAPVSDGSIPDSISVLRDRFRNLTAEFFDQATLLPECEARWTAGFIPQRINCLFASELLRHLADVPIFVIQSQYDLVHLVSDSGLLEDNAKADEFPDETSLGVAASAYVESFGDTVRASLDYAGAAALGASSSHYFFTPSCAHHGYIVPSSLHRVETQTQQIGEAGGIQFDRNSSVFLNITVAGLNVRSGLAQWLLSDGERAPIAGGNGTEGVGNDTFPVWNNVRRDGCTSFLCNQSCLASVVPWRLGTILPECLAFVVLAYSLLLIFLFYFLFFLSYVRILSFRSFGNKFWNKHKKEMAAVPASQLTLKRGGSLATVGLAPVQESFLSEVASSEFRKMHLMIRDLEYAAPPRGRRDKPHLILRRVNLNFKPGEVHALMGPSGSGKSTLLDILALTRDSGLISGKHFINGVETWSPKGTFLKEWLRHNLSYVGQSDVLFPQLTVLEHLTHAAWLLLPEFMDDESRLLRVFHVIKLLELESCVDTICGDGGITVNGGISGGQRRRVSIATQLLRMPAALLLDEPTSGLDSTNALLLVKSLHLLAHQAGVNVVMTIHQPRKEIYGFLDHLSILVRGEVIFSGPTDSAARHFRVAPGGMSNVGNEILDIISKSNSQTITEFRNNYLTGSLGKAVDQAMASEVTDLSTEMALTLRTVLMENALGEGRWSWTESSSASTLMWVLMSRTFRRGGFDLPRTCTLSVVGGTLVGLMFLGVDSPTSRTALSYLLVASLTLVQSTFLGDRYLGEKEMFHHERSSGTVTAWSAFLASQFIRNAVSSTTETLCFALPVYFLGGMNMEFVRVLQFVLIMSLVSLAVISQNLWIQIDRNTVRGSALMQIVFIAVGALFNGFIIRLQDLPDVLSWLPYLLINYWGFVATLLNDLAGVSFPCDSVNALECTARTGDAVARSLSYDNLDVPICVFALVAIIVVFHILAVLDFFLRYVYRRGSQLKHVTSVSGRATSNYDYSPVPGISPSFGAAGLQDMAPASGMGKTMDNMIAAAADKKVDGQTPPPSPAPRSPKKHVVQKGRKGGEIHFVDDEDDFGFDVNQGEFPDEDPSNPVIRRYPCMGNYLVSRSTLATIFLVDFVATGYICANDGSSIAQIFITGVTIVFSLLYAIQFIFQLAYLVPASTDGSADCTWGGVYDGVGVVCVMADLGLSIQLVSSLGTAGTSPQVSFVVLFALQMVVRFTRFARVWTFWNKVTAYHRVRASVFLSHRLAPEDPAGQTDQKDQRKNPPLLPPRKPRISIRRPKVPPRQNAHAPPRPPRPTDLSSALGSAPPRPTRSRETLNLGRQWASYQHSSNGSNHKVTYNEHQRELLARLQQQQLQQLRYSSQQRHDGRTQPTTPPARPARHPKSTFNSDIDLDEV